MNGSPEVRAPQRSSRKPATKTVQKEVAKKAPKKKKRFNAKTLARNRISVREKPSRTGNGLLRDAKRVVIFKCYSVLRARPMGIHENFTKEINRQCEKHSLLPSPSLPSPCSGAFRMMRMPGRVRAGESPLGANLNTREARPAHIPASSGAPPPASRVKAPRKAARWLLAPACSAARGVCWGDSSWAGDRYHVLGQATVAGDPGFSTSF